MYKSITLDCQTITEKLNCEECIAYQNCTTKKDGKEKTLAEYYCERDAQEKENANKNKPQNPIKKASLAVVAL
jgi:hypothetical protein